VQVFLSGSDSGAAGFAFHGQYSFNATDGFTWTRDTVAPRLVSRHVGSPVWTNGGIQGDAALTVTVRITTRAYGLPGPDADFGLGFKAHSDPAGNPTWVGQPCLTSATDWYAGNLLGIPNALGDEVPGISFGNCT
jgi:hypothetical protein